MANKEVYTGFLLIIAAFVLFPLLYFSRVVVNLVSTIEQIVAIIIAGMICSGAVLIYHGRHSAPPPKPDLEKSLEAHRKQVLGIYEGILRSGISEYIGSFIDFWASLPYSFPPIRLQVGFYGLPDQERYYEEAIEDLKCYRVDDQTLHDVFENAKSLVNHANAAGLLIVTETEKSVASVMKKYGLKEWNNGGHQSDKWYSQDCVIRQLILRPLATGEKTKLEFEDRTHVIRADGCSLVGSNFDEAQRDRFMRLLSDFQSELDKAQEPEQPDYFARLSKRIMSLQEAFDKATAAYEQFKDNLRDCAVKQLETGLPIPNGGECRICLSLRA